MTITRRRILAGSLASLPFALTGIPVFGQEVTKIKISHQFPGGTITQGDFRDRLCRKFAAEVEKRSAGKMKFEIYPGSSLMKVNAQFSALRKGALDMTLLPLPYAGGEVPEVNIALMPGLVTSYEQGMRWKDAEIGKALSQLLADKGLIIVTWVWQAGGAASRAVPVLYPKDAKGLKIRGGSREMDMVFKAAGASTLSLPSSEAYAAMQTGAADAVVTSSTSLISFRLEEVSKHLTTSKVGKSYWFMLEPLLMSKAVFDKLPKDQQKLIMTVGTEMEKFGMEEAKGDDISVAEHYAKAGATIHEMTDDALGKWVAIAKETAWKDYAGRSENCARLLKLAQKVT